MENLAHTLLGLTLAKAGLERATPLATTALVVSSNLPDIDVITGTGGTIAYLNHHRGFTHSLVGLALLSLVLTFVLAWVDRKFRLRRDPFRRPLRPVIIFAISYLGGLGHLLMDFTNNYGVRPLIPFSDRWFYGDIIFVVDPWIWLILGSAAVWLTTVDPGRAAVLPRLFIALRLIFWIVVGAGTALVIALALREPAGRLDPVPLLARLVWFGGFLIILTGVATGWGRAGARLARYSLAILLFYYAGMWMAHQSALGQARDSIPAEGLTTVSAWPTPANPALWSAVATTDRTAYTRLVRLNQDAPEWRELPLLEPQLLDALKRTRYTRDFLDFMRYGAANVEERADGYTVTLRDLRFNLSLRADIDREMNVVSAHARWN
ncbi:MAG TPA: metal-dependent hydrolase [Blastocatellia bacterium]|jgi:inner membrane protein